MSDNLNNASAASRRRTMKTDKEKHDLRGAVRSVRVELMKFEGDEEQIEKFWYGYTVSFDFAGNITEHVHDNPDGSAWRTANDYAEDGKLSAARNYDPSGQLAHEVRYSYDAEGRLVAEQTRAPDGTTNTPVIYTYDSENRRTKIETLDLSEDVGFMIGIEDTNSSIAAHNVKRIETRYTEHGAAIEVLAYNADGALAVRVEVTRDADGNVLEETQYLGDVVSFEPCSTEETCATGEPAPLTEEQRAEMEAEIARVFAPGAPMSRHLYAYDENGRVVEASLTMMGMQVSRQTFAYDEMGNKAEEASYDEDGTLQSKAIFTRKYDEQGNWTEEIVSSASAWDAEFGISIPQHVTRRFITYDHEAKDK